VLVHKIMKQKQTRSGRSRSGNPAYHSFRISCNSIQPFNYSLSMSFPSASHPRFAFDLDRRRYCDVLLVITGHAGFDMNLVPGMALGQYTFWSKERKKGAIRKSETWLGCEYCRDIHQPICWAFGQIISDSQIVCYSFSWSPGLGGSFISGYCTLKERDVNFGEWLISCLVRNLSQNDFLHSSLRSQDLTLPVDLSSHASYDGLVRVDFLIAGDEK
jgi:hypothetical protein